MSYTVLVIACFLLVSTTVFLFAWMISYYALMSRIEGKYPNYYEKIGKPFLPKANLTMIARTIHRDAANYRYMRQLCSGLPPLFPKDKECRKMARNIRHWILISSILVVIDLPVVTLAFFK